MEKSVPIKGKDKINLVSATIKSDVLYVPSFPFQLLSVHKLIHTLNCEVIFTSHKVVFQDQITKQMIGERFFLNGLYYFLPERGSSKGFQVVHLVNILCGTVV